MIRFVVAAAVVCLFLSSCDVTEGEQIEVYQTIVAFDDDNDIVRGELVMGFYPSTGDPKYGTFHIQGSWKLERPPRRQFPYSGTLGGSIYQSGHTQVYLAHPRMGDDYGVTVKVRFDSPRRQRFSGEISYFNNGPEWRVGAIHGSTGSPQ